MENTKTDQTASIGAWLLDAGKIDAKDAERILALQKQQGIRFGDAAKALGLITDSDIQAALSHQFDFPILGDSDNYFSADLIAAYQPFSAQVEALRTVRWQLMLHWLAKGKACKTLAIVSPSRREGRSNIAANLAIVFSQLGERTLLIDGDLRQPSQHTLFKLNSGYGLADVLAGRAECLSVVTKIPAFRDLSILPAGTIPPNPAELLSRGLKTCLQELAAKFDVILIDTSSAELGMDGRIIAANCGDVLVVARKNATKLDKVQLLKEALQSSGCDCVGSVLTDF